MHSKTSVTGFRELEDSQGGSGTKRRDKICHLLTISKHTELEISRFLRTILYLSLNYPDSPQDHEYQGSLRVHYRYDNPTPGVKRNVVLSFYDEFHASGLRVRGEVWGDLDLGTRTRVLTTKLFKRSIKNV